MVPMMVSPQDSMYHQGPNCAPPVAAAHPYHQVVPATSRPYYSSMLTAAPSTAYHHQQPASVHELHPQESAYAQIQHQQPLLMTFPSPAENVSQHPLPGTPNAGSGCGGEGLSQGTAYVEELEQAHQSQPSPNTSATGTGTTMLATVGGIGSLYQPPQGGNTMVYHSPPLQQPPMMTMYPTNQVGIPISTMSFGYNYLQQQQQQQQSMYQIVSQPPPTYVAGHSLAPQNGHNRPNTSTVHYQNLGPETAAATGSLHQQQHAIATIDPTASNNVSHVQLGHNDSAITSVQQPQQQFDDVVGGNIDQLLIISSDKRSTSATSMNQAGGGGNLAHCA